MQNTEYGPEPSDIRVFEFGNDTLREIENAVEVHNEVVGERYLSEAKRHLGEAAHNARRQDKLLGIRDNLMDDCHSVLSEAGTLNIRGLRYQNSRIDRLADEFWRRMSRAETAEEVGHEHVATEEP